MSDRDFLGWIHDRLVFSHSENELADYMHKLRCIIASTPPEQDTPNDGRGKNSITELRKSLGVSTERAKLNDGHRPTFDEFFHDVREAGADGWDKVEDIGKEIDEIRGR